MSHGDLDRNRVAARGALWSASATVISQALSFLVFLAVARLMGPADFGLITLSMTVILVVTASSGLGLAKLLVQLEDPGKQERDTAFLLSTLTGSMLTLALWLAAPYLADALSTPELRPVMRALAAVVILRALGVVPEGLMVREFRFKAIAVRTIMALLISGATGIVLALKGYGVWALVAMELVKAAASSLGLWLVCGWTPGTSVSITAARRMLGRSMHIMGFEISHIANHHLDRFLIGGFLGVVSLGIFAIAAKVNRIAITIMLDSLADVALPTFSRNRADHAMLSQVYYRCQRIGTAMTLPVFVLLIITADSVIPLLLGPQWQSSVPVLQALCLASCASSIGVFNTPLLLATGRGDVVFRLSLMNTLAGLVAFFISAHWGILGVSLAFAARAWLILAVEFALCRRYSAISSTPIRVGLTRQLPALAAMSIAVLMLPRAELTLGPWPLLVTTLVLGAICYTLTLALADRELAGMMRRVPALLRGADS